MKVTKNGQITIPAELRRRFAIVPHTNLEFAVVDGRKVVHIEGGSPGSRLVQHLAGRATTGISTDELMELTRGENDFQP